jgi:glycogen phosphorylase
MQSIGTITVTPKLPASIARLEELAQNLYWSWNPAARDLFREINPAAFTASHHSPMRVLFECHQTDLERVAGDKRYLGRYQGVIRDFDAYMNRKDTWFKAQYPKFSGGIAYFSMEYGLHESLQIYSGGLGVLAGDHCKSASDLGLPFSAVGLMYREGSFHQNLNREGWQEEWYETIVPENVGAILECDQSGAAFKIGVEISGRTVWVQIWRLQIGRIALYLLDAAISENDETDRKLTARLYGAGGEFRVAQELLLGVGGVRALRALKIEPSVFHMNEGHAAFLGLERTRELMLLGLNRAEALEVVAASGIFTTHTPVPAGNDAFALDMIDKKLGGYWLEALQISRDELMALAMHQQPWGASFSMTVLALRCSRYANGVSELHGEVSRGMWNFLWAGAEVQEVPITHVTNGVHTRTFLANELAELYDAHFKKNWDDHLEKPESWLVDKIPDADLWNARLALKKKLIRFARSKLQRQNERNNVGSSSVVLEDHVLTIGFARRFATYKRATLLFRDLDRLKRIVNNPNRPVQFIFAGKAHPADNPGKEFIQQLWKFSQDPELRGKVLFLEDYDMNVARHLVQGSDIWLNNPRRPLEASGTSGEKASLNGCINFSILDGWWREASDGSNGWNIGSEREFGEDDESLRAQDDADSQSLYDILEFEIAPLYYGEKIGNPGWLTVVRNAIRTVGPKFSMQRQVQDYTNELYAKAQANGARVAAHDFKTAKELTSWKANVHAAWNKVRLEATLTPQHGMLTPGQHVNLSARVFLGDLTPQALRVEAILENGSVIATHSSLKLEKQNDDGWASYSGAVTIPEAGEFKVGVRAVPYREDLTNALELGLIRWA